RASSEFMVLLGTEYHVTDGLKNADRGSQIVDGVSGARCRVQTRGVSRRAYLPRHRWHHGSPAHPSPRGDSRTSEFARRPWHPAQVPRRGFQPPGNRCELPFVVLQLADHDPDVVIEGNIASVDAAADLGRTVTFCAKHNLGGMEGLI